jgi:peptide/nickel transport system substrate-binding protein
MEEDVSDSNYWQSLMGTRASRRGVVIGGAGLAGAAALLAACGGGSSSDDKGATGSGPKIFTETKEETPVKTGGIYAKWISGDVTSLDPYKQTAAGPNSDLATFTMSRLVNFKTGPGVDPNNYEPVGDLASAWEISDGGLTYTFKLRPGVKFHNIAPVNGRVLDAEDVVSSYKRFSVGLTGGVGATTTGTAGSPSFGNSFKGVVASVTSPDKDTVVWKLTKPNAAFLNILGSQNFFWVFPKEVDVSYDPLKTVIGTGPWVFDKYIPSSRMEFKKNPEYYEKGIPYMDGVTTYTIPEAAQRIAQFSTGSIHLFTPDTFDNFKSLIDANPNFRIMGSGVLGSVTGIGFGVEDPNGPFVKDVRLRHALSMAIDRQTIMEEFNDIEKYKAIGLVRDYRYGMYIPPNLSKYWIDPRSKEMGDANKWAQYDVQGAKQLMSAAGMANGFDFAQRYASRNTGPSQEVHPILQQQHQDHA